uniref:Uncharacterized protein n=2 Tax=Pygocentrus nattereri TaxID=42514 RepID=A0A3B4D5D5_PYGNA
MSELFSLLTFPESRLLALTRSSASSRSCCTFLSLDRWALLLSMTYPGLQFLELFLSSFHGQILSLIQAVLQVLDCDLKVLLHPLQVSAGSIIKMQLGILCIRKHIIPAPDLRVQSALHGLSYPLAVPLDLLNFLIFLCKLPVNLTLDLVELKLDTKNLGLLMF